MKIAIECTVCQKVFFVERPSQNGVPFQNVLRCHLPSKCEECCGKPKTWKRSKEANRERESRKRSRERDRRIQLCQNCGIEFSGHKRKFCSQKCREESVKRKRVIQTFQKTCSHCGIAFEAKQRNSKFCCLTCRRKANAKKRVENWKHGHIGIAFPQLPLHSRRGNAAEHLCDAFCALYGIPCFAPIVDNQPAIDRVIWIEGRWQAVQIRIAMARSEDGGGSACCSVSRDMEEHIDLFCAVSLESGYVRFVDKDQLSLFGERISVPSPCDIEFIGMIKDKVVG